MMTIRQNLEKVSVEVSTLQHMLRCRKHSVPKDLKID